MTYYHPVLLYWPTKFIWSIWIGLSFYDPPVLSRNFCVLFFKKYWLINRFCFDWIIKEMYVSWIFFISFALKKGSVVCLNWIIFKLKIPSSSNLLTTNAFVFGATFLKGWKVLFQSYFIDTLGLFDPFKLGYLWYEVPVLLCWLINGSALDWIT